MNVQDIIDIARRNIRTSSFLTPEGMAGTWPVDMVIPFNQMNIPESPWRGWIYHVPIPKEHAQIKYRDVKMDQSVYDYDKIVGHALSSINRFNGGAIWVTDAIGGKVFVTDKCAVQRPGRAKLVYPFNPLQPMYERVRAMCAYAHSAAFNSPTVFLDGDAFVNTDLTRIFKAIPDIAVTYRHHPGLMPINEGVIFANPTEGARAFFRAYLATYENLAKVPEIVDYYGDIKRWRGGQLSLNALTCPLGVPSEVDRLETSRYVVGYLPCHVWNFSVEMDQSYSKADLDAKAVIHLKGGRKALVDQVIEYQNAKP